VVERAVAMSRPLYDGRHQAIHIEVADGAIPIDVDVTRMVQVVSNLLINAAKYSDRNGRVEVTAFRDDDDAVIRVVDQGRGIDPLVLPTIFDSFVQVAKDQGGLGVGLTLARRLVEMHGGTISATSAGLGKGSAFEVRVPIHDGAPDRILTEDSLAHHAIVASNGASALRIVLIDDNADIRETMQQLLECLGHRVAVASDGPTGVELVLHEKPQVALVDIGLPGLDGYAVARRLRAAIPQDQLRLIAMTGFGQSSDRDQALAAGFDSHLIKPARTEQIQRALKGE
jgi:CheY-like chemotaxis protein